MSTYRQAPTKAAEFNAICPPGTLVRYFPIHGDIDHIEARTRTEAWELGHGAAVVALEGRTGGVLLEHIAIAETPAPAAGRPSPCTGGTGPSGQAEPPARDRTHRGG